MNLKFQCSLNLEKKMSSFLLPFFSKDAPNKIGEGINVYGKNTLIKTDNGYRVAIAEESIDAKVDGKKLFCVRVDHLGDYSMMMIGFTPMETFHSTKEAYFGVNDFTGTGMFLYRKSFLSSKRLPQHHRRQNRRKSKRNHHYSHDKQRRNEEGDSFSCRWKRIEIFGCF